MTYKGIGEYRAITLTANADAPGAIAPAINTLGTSGNDTYNGVIDTSNTSTLGTVDSLDGQGGTDSLNVRIVTSAANTTAAPVVKNVENFNLTNLATAGDFTLNFASIEGEQAVWSTNSVAGSDTRAVGVTSATTAGLDSASGTFQVNYAGAATRTGTADAFTLAVKGAGTSAAAANFNLVQADGTTIDSTFEVANIQATGAASNIAINAGSAANGLRVINVTGDAAGLRLTDAAAATSLRTVDASGMTGAGGLNLNASSSTQTNFKFTGSAQNDRLVLDSTNVLGVANTVALNAGEGKDTLAVTTATAFTAAAASVLVSNINTKAAAFEVLEANANNVTALKANDFTNINEFAFTGTTQTAALSITGVQSADKFIFSSRSASVDFDGAAVNQTAAAAVGGGVTMAGGVGAAGTDNSGGASGTAGGAGANGTAAVTFGNNVTSLTIESTGTTANVIQGGAGGAGGAGAMGAPGPANGGAGGNGAVAIDNNTEVQVVTITGSQNLTIAGGAGGAGGVAGLAGAAGATGAAGVGFSGAVEVNATALTGNLDISLSTANDIIKFGSGNNSYRATTGNDAITLNSGNDTLFYTNANQSLTDATSDATILSTIDIITGWGAGTDVVNLNGVASSFVALNAGTQTAVGTAGTLKAATDAVMNQLAANQSAAFQYSGNTYVVADVDGNTTLDNADFLIQLVGEHTITATSVSFA